MAPPASILFAVLILAFAGAATPVVTDSPRLAPEAPVAPMRSTDLPPATTFAEERAPFVLRLAARGRVIAYRIASTSVLPGEVLDLTVDGGRAGLALRTSGGRVSESVDGWRWEAPAAPGTHALRVEGPVGDVHVNVFVAVPGSAIRDGSLHGYRIGEYRPSESQPPPRGFVEVGPEDEDVLVSPHFTIGQFLCKQPGVPRYVVVSVPLVMKLEALLARVVAAGHDARTLHVMSAFRTPWYNRQIGNTTTMSRHLYGEAADVFVDADGDGHMDDMNGDGRRDVADARALFDLIEEVERARRPGLPGIVIGGLKAYRRNQVRGPFVHVDVRGKAARW